MDEFNMNTRNAVDFKDNPFTSNIKETGIILEVENFADYHEAEKDYNKIEHKPQINSVELIGNKTGEELKLLSKETFDLDRTQTKAKFDTQEQTNKDIQASIDTLFDGQQNTTEQVQNIERRLDTAEADFTTFKSTYDAKQKDQDNEIIKNSNAISGLGAEIKGKIETNAQGIKTNADNIIDINSSIDLTAQKIEINKANINLISEDLGKYKLEVAGQQEVQDTQLSTLNTSIEELTTGSTEIRDLVSENTNLIKVNTEEINNNKATFKAFQAKTEEAITKKADSIVVQEQLELKADEESVQSRLSLKATKEDVIKKQDLLSSEQLENIAAVPNKADVVELTNYLLKTGGSLTGDLNGTKGLFNKLIVKQAPEVDIIDETFQYSVLSDKGELVKVKRPAVVKDLEIPRLVDSTIITSKDTVWSTATTMDLINSYFSNWSYEELKNKPSINSVELVGNKNLAELGIQAAGNYPTKIEMTDADNEILKLAKEYTDENSGGGIGGTTNYNSLNNKPQINGIELKGNKTLNELGIASKDYVDAQDISILEQAKTYTDQYVPEIDLSEYTKTVDIPNIKVNEATNTNNLNNIPAGDYALKTEIRTDEEINALIDTKIEAALGVLDATAKKY